MQVEGNFLQLCLSCKNFFPKFFLAFARLEKIISHPYAGDAGIKQERRCPTMAKKKAKKKSGKKKKKR